MNVTTRNILFASAALAAQFAGAPALAQVSDGSVEEVVVTALRREQTLQDVPAAIAALSGAALDERGVTRVEDLQYLAPSMESGKLLGQTGVSIRGVGLNQGAPGVAVAVHVDGVFQTSASMGDLTQVDLARVEVLRGPQGTLYGRNANGGAVNFITAAPTDRNEGYVLAGYASYAETKLQSMVNVPLNDSLRSRVVVDWTKRRDGFVENVIPGGQDVDKGETLSARLRVTADLAPNLTLDLTGSAESGEGATQYFVLRGMPSPEVIQRNPILNTATYSFEPWRTSANSPMTSSRDLWSGSAILAWQVGNATIKSITGFTHLKDQFRNDDDGISVSMFPARRYYKSNDLTQELNGSLTIGRFDLIAGLFYLNTDLKHVLDYDVIDGAFPLPPNSDLRFDILENKTEAYAAYVDATAHVTDRLAVFGGVRFSKEEQTLAQRNSLSFGPTPSIFTCPLQTNSRDFDSTTPRLGASYEATDGINLYATYSKGYKAGGFNVYGCNNSYAPKKLTAYETGLKGRFLDGSLTLNVAAFYYDYTDLQVSQVIGLARFITNAAAAEVKGLELEANAQPDEHWTINGNVTLLDARYEQFNNIDGLNPAAGVQDLSGNRLNRSPEVSVNLGLGYKTDATDLGRIIARVDASYRSKTYYREFNDPLDAQKAYVQLNANLIWESPEERYRVRLYATNLTNEAHIAALDGSDAFGSRFITWAPPRQVGVELKYGF